MQVHFVHASIRPLRMPIAVNFQLKADPSVCRTAQLSRIYLPPSTTDYHSFNVPCKCINVHQWVQQWVHQFTVTSMYHDAMQQLLPHQDVLQLEGQQEERRGSVCKGLQRYTKTAAPGQTSGSNMIKPCKSSLMSQRSMLLPGPLPALKAHKWFVVTALMFHHIVSFTRTPRST